MVRKPSPAEQDLEVLQAILAAPHPGNQSDEPAIRLFPWRNDSYAFVPQDSGYEAMRVESDSFRAWLRRSFIKRERRAVSSAALRSAIASCRDEAIDQPEEEVFRRVGKGELWTYIDLANDAREYVEIQWGSWAIDCHEAPGTPSLPARHRKEVAPLFLRSGAMRPFPKPRRHGPINLEMGKPSPASLNALEHLCKALNLGSEGDFQLLMTWCVAALMPTGPYPILAIGGPQGSAKSTLARLVHELVDPSFAPLRSLPLSEKELFIAASNAHLLAFDNVSTIPAKISDALCKLATGGSLSLRKIGTHSEEIYLNFNQPVILNGIGEIIQRPDLADRTLFLNLPVLQPYERRHSRDISNDFSENLPSYFGAILDLVALAMHDIQWVEHNELPRMADFAKIGIAIERSFGPQGSFLKLYEANRNETIDELIELDPMAMGVLKLAEGDGWKGTTEELRNVLHGNAKAEDRRAIPTGLAQLASSFKRITPLLERRGVIIHSERQPTPDRRRIINIFRL